MGSDPSFILPGREWGTEERAFSLVRSEDSLLWGSAGEPTSLKSSSTQQSLFFPKKAVQEQT